MLDKYGIGVFHKGLRYELRDRLAAETGVITLLLGIIAAASAFMGTGIFTAGIIIMTAANLALTVYRAFGGTYKKALAAYEVKGMDMISAEKDFESGIMVRVDADIICAGEECLFYRNDLRGISVNRYGDVKWVFIADGGEVIPTGRDMGTRTVDVILCFKGGTLAMTCPEGAADGITDIICEKSGCPMGWDSELWDIYVSDPEKFEWKRMELRISDAKARRVSERAYKR